MQNKWNMAKFWAIKLGKTLKWKENVSGRYSGISTSGHLQGWLTHALASGNVRYWLFTSFLLTSSWVPPDLGNCLAQGPHVSGGLSTASEETNPNQHISFSDQFCLSHFLTTSPSSIPLYLPFLTSSRVNLPKAFPMQFSITDSVFREPNWRLMCKEHWAFRKLHSILSLFLSLGLCRVMQREKTKRQVWRPGRE